METLKTKRLILRSWRQGDEPSLVKYANNPNVARFLRNRFPHPYTVKDAQSWIAMASSRSPLIDFAIEVQSQAVGGVGFILGEDIYARSAEIGYWLGEPFWGKGLATEAVKLATDYAFATFDLVRLHAGVFDSNPASARVLEKAGYTLESRMRKAVFKNGKLHDELRYVVIR